jgi:Ribonuclease D
MLKYAREDTHYLLYIYDELRKAIVDASLKNNMDPVDALKSVLNKSKLISLRVYKKPVLKNENYYKIMSTNKAILSRRKYKILKAIYKWRDTVARQEDESPFYILASNIMFDLVNQYPLTKEQMRNKFRQFNYIKDEYIDMLIAEANAAEQKAEQEKIQIETDNITVRSHHANESKAVLTSVIFDELAPEHNFRFIDVKPTFQCNQNQVKDSHDYHKIFAPRKPAEPKKAIQKICESFNYLSLQDFPLSFNPNFKDQVVQLQKEYVLRMKEKIQIKQAESKAALNQAKLDGEGGLILFSEEKKEEAPVKKEKELRLELNNKDETKMPNSLKDAYDVSLKKRKRKDKGKTKLYSEQQSFNEKFKKVKQDTEDANAIRKLENKYANLVESSDEEVDIDTLKSLSKKNKNTFQSIIFLIVT